MAATRQAEETRQRILSTALELFHSCSFKGTSVNQIVAEAGITKGALFHHFKGKNELGYAIVDELLAEEIKALWVTPLEGTTDPVTSIREILERMGEEVRRDPEALRRGCPVNNLSQEMSAVDEIFREKLKAVYALWLSALEEAFRAGLAAGTVKEGIDPFGTATVIVALFEGAAGLVKVHREEEFINTLGEALHSMLEGLRP
ncbi:TetR/AcrR family transcriptional regulator [Pelagicoccus mobilis]|uniref:TetR/AcrR family transcriptional regulator n=1 Tax=Pelagicoccus mobilis TaxID=415221 RepID=A0A934S095_9BACT|nr:TetR/AcrR family transcriptional regulator [Pelagicoccus mobilis]MBK1878176.1 TetR/AcrR family transcriptional regulator [Pelagicoccus mobilis]